MLLKCLIFLIEWFLKCLSKYFRDFFSRAENVFLIESFCQICKVFVYHSPAHIIECVSEYTFSISKTNKQKNKNQKEQKKLKEKENISEKLIKINEFVAAGVKIFLVTHISRKQFIFLAFLSLIIVLFSWRMIMSAVLLFLENRGFTVYQNFLVTVIPAKFKLLKYCCFVFRRTFVHVFLCFLQFCKVTQVQDLLNLLCNFKLLLIVELLIWLGDFWMGLKESNPASLQQLSQQARKGK